MTGHDGVRAALAIGPTSEVLPTKRAAPKAALQSASMALSNKRPAPARRAKFQLWIFSYRILVGLANFVLSRVMLAWCWRACLRLVGLREARYSDPQGLQDQDDIEPEHHHGGGNR